MMTQDKRESMMTQDKRESMMTQDNKSRKFSARFWKILAANVAIVLTVLLAGWWFFGYYLNNLAYVYSFLLNNIWFSWLFPGGWNLLHATPFFWLLVLGSVAGVISARFYKHGGYNKYHVTREERKNRTIGNSIVGVFSVTVVIVFGFTSFMWGDWNARFYNQDSTYKVANLENLPNSLERVQNSEKAQVSIEEGKIPSGWVKRNASATGAAYVMQKTGDNIQNSRLLKPTISYIYDNQGLGGEWTAIRNGLKRQPIHGVVSWRGTGEKVESCVFKGDNKLDKAFDGKWGMNLQNSIAKFDPMFIWDPYDMYGYCDGDTPILVLPGTRVVSNGIQAASDSFGVLTIKGSPSGSPVFEFHDTVEPGDFPGAIYPKHLLDKQRDALSWSAGRVWPWNPPVGFEVPKSVSQDGNSDNFLLKNKEDNRLYWVTPLKPANADSETITAYSVTAADELKSGKMNEQVVYVLEDDDTNIVNFNDLENAVTQAVSKADPGFFTGGQGNVGKIVEFTPTNTGEWRVFAERGGRAVYEINVSGGSLLQTSIVGISEDGDVAEPTVKPQNEGPGASCDTPESLSDAELAKCFQQLSEELESRLASE